MLRNASLYGENPIRTRCGISNIVPLDSWNLKKTLAMQLSSFKEGKRTLAPFLYWQNARFKRAKACETWLSMERKERERVGHRAMLLFVCLSFLVSIFVSWCLWVFLSDFLCLSRRYLTCTWIRVIKYSGHWLISPNLTKVSKHVISECEGERISQDMYMSPSNRI